MLIARRRSLWVAVWLAGACGGDSEPSEQDETATGEEATSSASATTASGTSAGTSGSPVSTGQPDTSTSDAETDSSGSTETGGEPMCPDTRLPGAIAGVEPESHSHHPPIVDGNDNLYRMTETSADDGNNPQMLKSSDGGATWAEVDAGNRPSATDLEGTYQLQIGTSIFFSVTRGQRVWWFGFNTSDAAAMPDQWTPTEMVDDDLTSGGVRQASSLVQTSDEQFWLAYSDLLIDGRQQIAIRRRTGVDTYGPKTTVDLTSGSWTGPRVVLGRDDVTHLFYNDDVDRRLLWRTLSADGDLSGATRIDSDGTSDVPIPHTHTVIYDRGDEEVMVLAFSGADDTLKALTITDGVVGPEEQVSSNAVLQDADVVTNEGAVAHVALDGTTVHAIWSDEASGDLLHRSKPDEGDWSEEQTLWTSDGESALYIYCTVLRSGNCPRLSCTYDIGPHEDDAGNIQYDEFVLAE